MSEYQMLQDQVILYVEDDNNIRNELAEILEYQTKKVITASDGQEGYQLYLQNKPDIIVTDIAMPVLDGIEMIKKIRKDDSQTPIVITSAFDNGEYLKQSIELHVDKFITKPIDINILLEVLNRLSISNFQKKEIINKTKELERTQNLLSNTVLYTTSDLKGNITSVSKAFEKFTGFTKEELLGKNHSLFQTPDTPKEFYKNMWETLKNNEEFVSELKNYDKNGNEYWVKITIYPIFDESEKKIGYGSYRENITDKKTLEYISTHDTLTGVYNREYLQQELSKKIKSASRYGQVFSFVIVDIDHFKFINDTYGHHIGDEVLKKFSQSISEHIREDDIFARWGGEEFVIIANGADKDATIQLIQKIQTQLQSVNYEKVEKLTASYGIATYLQNDTQESILQRADKALYKAKNNGRNRYEITE